jgi:hypothetical protein
MWDLIEELENTHMFFNGCVWSDGDSLISASLYPEVLQLDTTCKTNLYNFPLTFLVGVNGENKSENWLTGLLPNEKRTTFIWLLHAMLPLFLGTALEGLQTVISDGNNEIIDAINYTIDSKVFPSGTVRLLCYWHTIPLFLSNELPFISSEMSKCLKDYLFEMATKCDTFKEVEYYWEAINIYVKRKITNEGKRVKIDEVLLHIQSKQAYWCRAWYPNARNFGEVTSGRVETENLHHKKDDQVHSRSSLKQTAEADHFRMERRKVQKQVKMLSSLRHPILETIKDQSLPPWVYEKLTHYGAKLFEEQWALSHNYIVSQKNSNVLSVNYADEADTDEGTTHKCHTTSVQDQFLQCSCIFVISEAMICRHLLAVMHYLDLPIQDSHIHLRWHKSWMNVMFLSHYHRHFNDGFNSIYLSSPLPNESQFSQESFPSSPSSLSLPSSPSVPSSPTSSQTAPPFQPYVSLKKKIDQFTNEIIQIVVIPN